MCSDIWLYLAIFGISGEMYDHHIITSLILVNLQGNIEDLKISYDLKPSWGSWNTWWSTRNAGPLAGDLWFINFVVGFLRLGVQGEGVFLRNPKDSGREDWGRLGNYPPLRILLLRGGSTYSHQVHRKCIHAIPMLPTMEIRWVNTSLWKSGYKISWAFFGFRFRSTVNMFLFYMETVCLKKLISRRSKSSVVHTLPKKTNSKKPLKIGRAPKRM